MKRLVSIALCLILIICLPPTTASAAPTVAAYDDGTIYVGGIYDMWAQISEGADRATYQWQVSIGSDDYYGSDAWYDIDDLAGPYGYKGTKTSHLQIVGKPNDDGVAIGSGWENMKFRCKITLDGKEYYTKGLSELRHNTATLNAVIKAGKYKLYEPKVTGLSKQSGSGSSYTATAAAGQELIFSIACKEVSETRLVASEFECIPEIWLTDGDTTVHAAKELHYTPTSANSQLVVEFKLRMRIGVNDLGYTETKTMNISTYLPATTGSATAKNRAVIYTTCSTNSKRVATVASGGTMDLVEKVNESWCKVAYNNKVGYVQVSDLATIVNQTINEVKTYLTAPTVGKQPRFDVTYATAGVQLYETAPVSWYDETAKRFLTTTDTFQSGHQYTLSIWVAAADSYRFHVGDGGKIQVTGYVNDSVVSVYKAYEQQPEKVIALSWTYTPVEIAHTCSLTPVKQKDPDCINQGQKAYYRCNSCGECYSDASGNNKISLNTWGILPATGHTPSDWRTTGIYHYKVCTTCGEMLESEDHKGGKATCTQKASCEICGLAYGQDEPSHKWSPTYLYKDAKGHAWICADCKAHSDVKKHTPGPAATTTTPQTCKDCDYILEPAKNHIHQLNHMPYVAATCLSTGTVEHYNCSGCSALFSDKDGTVRLPEGTSIIIPYLTHEPSDVWFMDAQFHWRCCKLCQIILDETQMLHDGENGICATCGYGIDTVEITQETEPAENAPTSTEPTPVETTPITDEIKEPGNNTWLKISAVVLVSFTAAITATVMILKKKQK